MLEAFHEAETRLLDLQREKRPIDAEYVLFGQQELAPAEAMLLAHGREYVEKLELRKQTRTAEKYSGHLNRLAQYLGQTPKGEQKDIALAALTEKWLLDYSIWLGSHGAKSPNTLHRRMAFMNTILNDARKRGLMYHQPMAFLKFDEQKVKKLKLTTAQIEQLERATLTGRMHDACNTFLMQIYAYGARIGDTVAWRKTDLQRRPTGTYLTYRTQKTDDVLEVKLNPAALAIVEGYASLPGPFLLPWLNRFQPTPGLSEAEAKEELYRKIESATAMINGELKKLAALLAIEGKLTSHVARHSFATLADSRIADKRKISAALGHKRFSTTEVYLSELRSEEINDAMGELWD